MSDNASPDGRKLDLKLRVPRTWVSWVGCMESALRCRGAKCDAAEVAGLSGYAFVVNVHPELCLSGPTAFDWSVLVEGARAPGIEVELASVGYDGEMPAELAERLFERVREEIDDGRPCVVWGAACAPEFAVVYGWQGSSYLVRSYRSAQTGAAELGPREQPEEPVPHDKLQAPGSVSAFFFGDAAPVDRQKAERAAVVRAARLLRGAHGCFDSPYAHGAEAFGAWADALEQGRANPVGNAYNLACYGELQGLAAAFLDRLGRSNPGAGADLVAAGSELAASARNLETLGRLFPFPQGGDLGNAQARAEAAKLLRDCRDRNLQALRCLSRALVQL